MRSTRLPLAAAIAILFGLFHVRAAAQEPIDQAMIAKIKAEGMGRSEVATLFHTLADVLGPRLSGSPAYVAAARWAQDRFKEWGLANPRQEAFEFGRGWSLEKLTVEMIAPRYMPHLDSWHTATGATDNADGVASAMEAMRLLTALGARPRRTIRVALWGGEEQGLLGARAYVKQHLASDAARSTIAVYLNDDPGTGRTYGFYMQKNEAAKRIFDAWLEPLRDLGVKRNVIEDIGSTDHVPFDEVGLPAFTVIKDFRNYDVRTRHTNADFADVVKVDDLKQSAVVLAVVAWHAAMRDEPIPRRRP